MIRFFLLFLCLPLSFSVKANAFVRFGEMAGQEFSPARGDVFEIPVVLDKEASVEIEIYSPDGELIRTLGSKKVLWKGLHKFVWDGKDEQGDVVPDEAYTPVLRANAIDSEVVEIDPREKGGGEILENIELKRNDHQSYVYDLPYASRVSIRAGIESGPLLKIIADWTPHAAGRNILHWDGFDEDGIVELKSTGRQKLVISAYKLPLYSIITYGNKKINYRDYYLKKGWKLKPVDLSSVSLKRGSSALSRYFYIPLLMVKSPEVHAELQGYSARSPSGLPLVVDALNVKVDLEAGSKWVMQESRYEIGYFIDNEFVSEEEQGYVPMSWRWKINKLKPGKHVLTINISGFRGQVGVKSIAFHVVDQEHTAK